MFRRRRGERGSTAVEFALVSIPLFAIVFGIIEYSLYFWSMQGGADAARQAARLSAVGKPADCATFTSKVKGYLHGVASNPNAASTSITRTYTDDSGAVVTGSSIAVGNTVTVTVVFNGYDFHFPFVPFINDGRVSTTAKARVDYVPSTPSAC